MGLDTPPIIMGGRVMVPARAVFESMGGSVAWDGPNNRIIVVYHTDVLYMTPGQTQATLNGNAVQMELPPTIIDGRTLIPLRFPAEAFGFGVAWDDARRAAILHSPNVEEGEEDNTTHAEDPTPPPGPPSPGLARDVSTVPIEPAPHPGTTITNLLSPDATRANAFVIVASSPITDVNHFVMPDNRLVVDIYNALSELTGPFNPGGPVSEVRSAQFSRSPNITRLVFHVNGAVNFSLALSYDRQTLTVAFATNTISNVGHTSTAHSDTFMIQGDFQPSVRLCSDGYPNYVTVFIDNAHMATGGAGMPNGVFSSGFTTGQQAEGLAYIRINIQDEWPAISLAHGRDTVAVTMHRGLRGVRYDFTTREIRISRSVATFDINQVQYREEYLINRYTFTLPAGVNGLGLGTLYISDGYISSVTFQKNTAGNTQVVIETSRIMAFAIHETATEYIVRGNLPRDIYPFIVVIDPGHGGRDPGAVHHGVRESDVVLAVSHMVMEYLNQNPNIRAYMTRHTDVSVANSWRANFANQMADLYVSIHANAVNNRPAVTGIETWYSTHARESMFNFTSRNLAGLIQTRLINATGAVDRGRRPNGTWIVLRDTQMPSVLAELGFLSNREEAERLANAAHQRRLARAIYEGIVAASQSYTPHR